MIFVVVVVELAADLDDETFKQIMRIFSSYDFRYSYFEIATRFRWQIDLAVVVFLAVVVLEIRLLVVPECRRGKVS